MKMMNKLLNSIQRQFVRHVYLLVLNALGVDKKFVTYIVQILRNNNQKDTAQHALKIGKKQKEENPNSQALIFSYACLNISTDNKKNEMKMFKKLTTWIKQQCNIVYCIKTSTFQYNKIIIIKYNLRNLLLQTDTQLYKVDQSIKMLFF